LDRKPWGLISNGSHRLYWNLQKATSKSRGLFDAQQPLAEFKTATVDRCPINLLLSGVTHRIEKM
jgi:hypothetical protein